MKNYIVIFLGVVLLSGCFRAAQKKEILATINDYAITREEFEEEFRQSPFAREDNYQSRMQFLNVLINRKLILQDAQSQGLDKNQDFLKTVERFWEQSLLKIAMERKAREISGSAFVSDKTVEDVYKKMVAEGKTDKPLDQMYNQIKWEITKLKETQAMNRWLERLRKNAKVLVNQALIKQE